MSPFIKDGDVITVSPLLGRFASVGEVAAYRCGEDRVVVHRVVVAAHGAYVFRGDNCEESDGRVLPAAVLGVVTSVEREGRRVGIGLGPERLLVAGLSRRGVLCPLVACASVSRRSVDWVLRRAQGASVGRRILRRLGSPFAVLPAALADEADLSRHFGSGAPLFERRGDDVISGFVARSGGRLVGFVELLRRESTAEQSGGARIHDIVVETRYRGRGIAKELMQQAIAAERAAGADELSITVPEGNGPALALCGKLGFRPRGLSGSLGSLGAPPGRGGQREVLFILPLQEHETRPKAASGPGCVDSAGVVA
jgi:ribosomal protein S18 acetylase RimI-like enzyme